MPEGEEGAAFRRSALLERLRGPDVVGRDAVGPLDGGGLHPRRARAPRLLHLLGGPGTVQLRHRVPGRLDDEDRLLPRKRPLAAVANDLSGTYALGADIGLEGADWTPLGDSSAPFTGTLYGNGWLDYDAGLPWYLEHDAIVNGIPAGVRYVLGIDPNKGPGDLPAPLLDIAFDANGALYVKLPPLANTEGATVEVLSAGDLSDWSNADANPVDPATGVCVPDLGDPPPDRAFFRYRIEIED